MKTASQLFYLALFALLHTSTSTPDSEAAAQSIVPETSDVCAVRLPLLTLLSSSIL